MSADDDKAWQEFINEAVRLGLLTTLGLNADGKTFLSRWGDQAHALGWTVRDLFGLLTVPRHAKPSFNRLARYDETG